VVGWVLNFVARRRLAAVLYIVGTLTSPAAAQNVITLSTAYSAPQFVAVSPDKTVIVSDTTFLLSALSLVNGAYTTTPTSLTSIGGFSNVEGVAVDQGGDILAVTNFNASNIGIFEFAPPNNANIYAESLSITPTNVQGTAFDSQSNFFFANSGSTVLEIPAPAHASAGAITIGQAGIDHAKGIVIDSQDNLFVADQLSASGQILKLTAASGYATIQTITAGNFQQPVGVALDARGNLYVTDSAHNTLTELLAPDYTTAAVIDNTHFSGPMGVALDADDNIFVVDTGHNALVAVMVVALTTVTPVAGVPPYLPLTVTLCRTDPVSGVCTTPSTPGISSTLTFATNDTATYSVFVLANGTVPFDPANNRLFMRFKTPDGVTRGATSVAARTQ
jgi:DNA-binding beta-propeller fold protein YncE